MNTDNDVKHLEPMIRFDMNRLAEICRRNDVARLRLFGSAAHGEDRPESDVDLLVDFGSPKGFFELFRLENELTHLFGRPVDLLTEAGLSPYLKESVLASTSVLFDAAA